MWQETLQFEALGAIWEIKAEEALGSLSEDIKMIVQKFEADFSRFRGDSLLRSVCGKKGVFVVGGEFVDLLRLYGKFYKGSGAKFTPLLGGTLSDMGYDENYSLKAKEEIRLAANFDEVVRIVDNERVEFLEEVDLDFGGLGKGYLIEKIRNFLEEVGFEQFLINGSGDIYYRGSEKIRVGLEDPYDEKKVIGIVPMGAGAMCASATNRRAWGKFQHIVDPNRVGEALESGVVASWVQADDAVTADALATSVFVCDPEELEKYFDFEYLIMNSEYKVLKSDGFKWQPPV